jgi:hypothetical protein
LALLPGQAWADADLTAVAHSEWPGGAPRGVFPRGYVRADGVAAVVYLGITPDGQHTDGRLHELALLGGRDWTHFDLTQEAGAPPGGDYGGALKAYVRGDGITAVVYVGNDRRIHELALLGAQSWRHFDLNAATPTGETGQLYLDAYVRADGTTAVVYQGEDDHVHELALVGGTDWRHFDLTKRATAPTPAPASNVTGVTAYVRGDGLSAVVFRGEDSHMHELALVGGTHWEHFDLTAAAAARGTPAPPGHSQRAYVRADGISAVVYNSVGDNHIHELALR